MKQSLIVAAVVASCLSVFAGKRLVLENANAIAFESPAQDSHRGWEVESFPIGNGWFGASIFGIPANERVQITENTVLSSWEKDNRPNLTDALEIRIKTGHEKYANYRRELNYDEGICRVNYTANGVKYSREFFANYPDKVIVMHFAASKDGALEFTLSAEAPFLRPFGKPAGKGIKGRTAEYKTDEGSIDVYQKLEKYRILFDSQVQVTTDGKREKTGENAIRVFGAKEATVIVSCGTNYRLSPRAFAADADKKLDPIDPHSRVSATMAAAAKRGYAELKARHLKDFTGMMGRTSVNFGGGNARLDEVYFQFGRYLLVSSARPGTLPPNLQGIWTDRDETPWGCGYWHNINIQMNYWPAFNCNLAECFEPYARFNAAFRPATRDSAFKFIRRYTPQRLQPTPCPDLWCVGTSVYPYSVSGMPLGGHSGPGTGGLTSKLFADWWYFTRDEAALKEYIWPVLHGMADFLTRCCVETNGLYLSAFSASPEQYASAGDAKANSALKPGYYHTVGCAFDQQMLCENARDLLALARELGTNDEVVAETQRQVDKYDPVIVGESGQVKEYREEKKYGEIGEYHHRHISHLVGLYPGTIINANTPDWMKAAAYSLNERGDQSTGWALAHRLCCWARLGNGERAHRLLANLLSARTYDNLWCAHPPFQIDGNFGGTAGIAEMLLQSHAGFIDLLPALPKEWAAEGNFKGLVARGNVEVDCEWENGKPTKAVLHPRKGIVPEVRFAGKRFEKVEVRK